MVVRAVVVAASVVALLGSATATAATTPTTTSGDVTGSVEEPFAPTTEPELTEEDAIRIALAVPKVADWLSRYPPDPTTEATLDRTTGTWTVKVWSGDAGQIVLVEVDDAKEIWEEAWTGPQVAWRMARGGDGAFAGKVLEKPWVWLGLCAIFLVGLGNLRRPLSLRNLDLLALLAFTGSLFAFNDANIFLSVPLVYPPLGYLLARAGWIGFRGRAELFPRSSLPIWALAAATVFLLGFRVALNVEGSSVIDVGYAGVIGADRILEGQAPYGNMPTRKGKPCAGADPDGRDRIQTNGRCESANERGDTYGPLSYVAYVPAVALLGWSGKWDALPAAHVTSIAMDVLALLAMFLVGRRFGGRPLGVTLAFAWVAYPFTAYTLNANTNDALMPALLLFGFLALTSSMTRGALVAAAGWVKFAAFLVAPLWLTYPGDVDRRAVTRFLLGFAAATAVSLSVLLLEPAPWSAFDTFLDRTVGFQFERNSPFSIWDWGQYHARGIPDLAIPQVVVQIAAIALAGVVAVVPRRKGPLELAALTAAVLLGFQLALTHWFYLYLPWVLPFVVLALFLPRPLPPPPLPAAEPDAVA